MEAAPGSRRCSGGFQRRCDRFPDLFAEYQHCAGHLQPCSAGFQGIAGRFQPGSARFQSQCGRFQRRGASFQQSARALRLGCQRFQQCNGVFQRRPRSFQPCFAFSQPPRCRAHDGAGRKRKDVIYLGKARGTESRCADVAGEARSASIGRIPYFFFADFAKWKA